jgi:methyl-accepting chemotaxis protein
MMIVAMWLQDPGSLSSGNSRLLMFFVAMVAIAMVAQAAVVIGAAIGAAKARKQLLTIVEEIRAKTLPVIDGAQGMMQELQPKFKVLTDNLVETSHVVRSKAAEFDETISEVNHRARNQTVRVDDMVTSVLDTTAGIASSFHKTVTAPAREFHGIMNGLKAGFAVLTGRRENHRAASAYSTPDDAVPDANPFGSGAKPYNEEKEPRL